MIDPIRKQLEDCKTIEEHFEKFHKMTFPNAPDLPLVMIREVFFAGAAAAWMLMAPSQKSVGDELGEWVEKRKSENQNPGRYTPEVN